MSFPGDESPQTRVIMDETCITMMNNEASHATFTFEMEECRDFIVFELAQVEQTPRMLGYEDGLKKIYMRLEERYGMEHAAEGLRIVYDLIENSCDAAGIGDDGDWWATWSVSPMLHP